MMTAHSTILEKNEIFDLVNDYHEIQNYYRCSKCGFVIFTARSENPNENRFIVFWGDSGNNSYKYIDDENCYIWDCDLFKIAKIHTL